MEPAAPGTPTSPQPALPPRRRSSFWRWLFVLVVVLAGLVIAAPHAVALPAVRRNVEAQLTRELGAPVRIEALGFSWLSGFGVRGLEIGNPPGFPAEHPFLRLGRADGDVGLLAALQGRPDVQGTIDGLQIWLDQREDGTTNAAVLFGGAAVEVDGPTAPPGEPARPTPPPEVPRARGDDLLALRAVDVALQLQNGRFELRRAGALVEAQAFAGRLRKRHGEARLQLDLDAEQPGDGPGQQPGRAQARASYDAEAGAADAQIDLFQFDLARLLPLVELQRPGLVAELAGKANGSVQLSGRDARWQSRGELSVAGGRLGGELLGGRTLQGEAWHCRPQLSLQPGPAGGTAIAAQDFALSLGPLRVQGLADAVLRERLGDLLPAGDCLGCEVELELDGGPAALQPWPQWLLRPSGTVQGTFAMPLAALATPDGLRRGWRGVLRSPAGKGPAAVVHGVPLAAAGLAGRLADGQLALGLLGAASGDNRLEARIDCRPGERFATALDLSLRDLPASAVSTDLLRYAVPMLAGGVDLRGSVRSSVRLHGPLWPRDGQDWVQLLDEWQGDGDLALQQASVALAAALRPLQDPLATLGPLAAAAGPLPTLGDGGRLAIDSFATHFTVQRGFVTTTAGEWLAKGRRIGVQGQVGLDGRLQAGFDLADLLRGHRDGERVLKVLGGRLPLLQLGGTLAAPTLTPPDLGGIWRDVLRNAAENQARDVLRRGLEELLKRR